MINAIKIYKVGNRKKFQVEYGYVTGKWNFRVGSFTLITKVPGGRATADKIAEALHKSWHRTGKIDGACRLVINRLLGVRTVTDWQPPAFWTGFQIQDPGRKMSV